MNINNCIAENCLSNLVSLRAACVEGDCTPYFVEDLAGIDLTFLANSASPSGISGAQYATNLINTASRIMLGDLEMILTSGYSLVEAFGETCSSCVYLNTFVAGGGVIVKNIVGSKFSELTISKVEINCNAEFGTAQNLVFNDGKTIKMFPFTAQGTNVVTPVILAYKTTEQSVKVYLENEAITLAAVDCGTTKGCGCGSTGVAKDIVINYSGLLLGMETTQQYGFKICASVGCSSDLLTCKLIETTPNIFGLTLLYKIGALAYSNAPLSIRNNRTTGFDDVKQQDMADYYESLYQQRLTGNTKVKGLKLVVVAYLNRNKDRCISCDSVYKISYATG